jgi:tRNA(Ile)-lysidine synthetase-like protein
LLAAARDAELPSIRAVFVHHGLDGSGALLASAQAITAKLAVELVVEEAIVFDGSDLEARARNARYRAIENVLEPGEVCCTAHTADDQAETVLMRLLRGSGATGLAGIPQTRGPFRRPFLGVSRAALRAYALDQDLPFTDDPANTDDRFLRTRIRSAVLPALEDLVGPSVKANLVTSANLLRKDDAELAAAARAIPVEVRAEPAGTVIAIPAAPLVTASEPLAARAVRTALLVVHDPYRGSFSDVAAVLATAHDGLQRVLTDDVLVTREQADVILSTKVTQQMPTNREVAVGDEVLWGGAVYLVTRSHSPALSSTQGRRTAIRDLGPGEALGFRAVSDGDRIDIDAGSTKVVEVLRAGGIAPRLRPFWLAVTIDGKIAAVHGLRVAPWARPVGGASVITIEREGPS